MSLPYNKFTSLERFVYSPLEVFLSTSVNVGLGDIKFYDGSFIESIVKSSQSIT
jgi:hypothetical protein